MKRCVQPVIHLAAVITVKWTVIGRFRPLSEDDKRQPWNQFRSGYHRSTMFMSSQFEWQGIG